jgi:hypothetical protein
VSSGLTQVIGLLLLTVVVLPCAFFTLLAFLDRVERSLSPAPTPTTGAALAAVAKAAVQVVAAPTLDDETDAEIVPLPLHPRTADPAAAAI